jgi:thioredoxin 1
MTVKSITSLPELQSLIKSGKAVAIDFFATWCGPCRMISPRFESLSEKFPAITFVKVDVDQAREIASDMQISAMPTFYFFKNGQKVETVVGADPSQLEKALAKIA